MNNQKGFTLIELIVVIVILGILAATALPKFADLSVDARIAKVQAARAAMESAAVLTHSAQLVQSLGAASSVIFEGATITMAFGYPTANAAGIGVAAGLVDPTTLLPASYSLSGALVVAADAGHPNCTVTYAAPAAVNAAPQITTPDWTLPTSRQSC